MRFSRKKRGRERRFSAPFESDGYFAFGEYTHTLRLASELADLRVGCANPHLRAPHSHKKVRCNQRANRAHRAHSKQKAHPMSGWANPKSDGYFAFGEYTHTLRLASELADLRVGCANPHLRAPHSHKKARCSQRANRAHRAHSKQKAHPISGWAFCLEQATGIEPAASAWEAEVLPLDYACDLFIIAQSVCLVKPDAKILQPFSSTKFMQRLRWRNLPFYFSSSDSSVGNAFSNCAPYQCPSAVAFIAASVKLPATRAASSGVLPRTRAPVNADAKISPVP